MRERFEQITHLILLVLAGLALMMWFYGATAAPDPLHEVPPEIEARLIVIDREAVDAAYRQQIVSLFSTWMKDDIGQPARASRGVNQARRAYEQSMAAIKHRAERRK